MCEEEKTKEDLKKINDKLKEFQKRQNDFDWVGKALKILQNITKGDEYNEVDAFEESLTNFINQNASTSNKGNLNAKKTKFEDVFEKFKKLVEAKAVDWDSINDDDD